MGFWFVRPVDEVTGILFPASPLSLSSGADRGLGAGAPGPTHTGQPSLIERMTLLVAASARKACALKAKKTKIRCMLPSPIRMECCGPMTILS